MIDFNILSTCVLELIKNGRYKEAINILLFMAQGDDSLDGGYIGEQIGQCFEALGDIHSAFYWHSRAAEENPEIRIHSSHFVAENASRIEREVHDLTSK